MTPHQFGFTKNKSAVEAIFYFLTSIVKALDTKNEALGIFFDLTKAFDLVDHNRLLKKLSLLGVRGQAYSWVESFLRDRSMAVQLPFRNKGGRMDSITSQSARLNVGVPQGSVLGPLLFLLYVNDLPLGLRNSVLCLFADDTSLAVTSPNYSELQSKALIETQSVIQWFKIGRAHV